ncbi:MAG: hypothetical protein J7J14_06115 [Thermotogaceae bacterium]|nr:hypothetical protein [Thermotogaceae bacterium]
MSHNLDHVFAIAADRIVVLRSGRNVGERLIHETTKEEIISMMVGSYKEE